MSERIRVGVLGCGSIAKVHSGAFAESTDLCEVVAVADSAPDAEGRIRELFGGKVKICGDYREVLEMPDVDAVDILLPHHLHMPAAIDSAQARKHILLEKVMARNVYECDRIIEACRESSVTCTVCHDRRYRSEWRGLKQIVDSGLLGEIRLLKLDHNQNVNPFGLGKDWIGTFDQVGGGAIMSCLTHQTDALTWFGGNVQSVMCMTKTIPDRMEGESIGVIVAQMESGALAELSINWATDSFRGKNGLWYEMVFICGSEGEAYFKQNSGVFARAFNEDVDISKYGDFELEENRQSFNKLKVDSSKGHTRCVRQWAHMLRGEPYEIPTTPEEARKAVEIAEAAYVSVEERKTVDLPLNPVEWNGRDTFRNRISQ